MIKNTLYGIGLLASFTSLSAFASPQSTVTPLTQSMQKIINEYYKNYQKTEHFTAIAASVFIPRKKPINAHDIKTVVKGTKGLPPYTKPITGRSLFDIGSITKSFTVVILQQLQAEGKLSLDDPLGKWLPQYTQWKEVTIRHLLNMTSGIPNYSDDPEFDKAMYSNLARVWTDEELLTYAHPDQPIKINKENLFDYSNSNYILAALIIEKITQDSFENQLNIRILHNKKNHLNNTFYPVGPQSSEVVKLISGRKVHGYYYDEPTDKDIDTFSNDLSWGSAAGAIVANTQDVVKWVQILYHGTLIPAPYRERALSEMEHLVSLKTGQPIPMVNEVNPGGFGLGIAAMYDKESKQAFYGYQGSTLGFRVMYLWSPCNDVTTVVALNSKGSDGDPKSKMTNHIFEANLNLYSLIMKKYPQLACAAIN